MLIFFFLGYFGSFLGHLGNFGSFVGQFGQFWVIFGLFLGNLRSFLGHFLVLIFWVKKLVGANFLRFCNSGKHILSTDYPPPVEVQMR